MEYADFHVVSALHYSEDVTGRSALCFANEYMQFSELVFSYTLEVVCMRG
jgi:hypothetical protein